MPRESLEVYAKTAGLYDRRNSNPYTMRLRGMEIDFIRRYARGRTLDAGCGTGFHLPYLKGMGLDVVGVEPVKEMREIAKAKGRVLDGDLEKLEFKDVEFETSICMYSVLNILDWKKAIGEMCRVSRGRVIISVPSVYDKGYTMREKRSLRVDKYAQIKKVHVQKMKMWMHLFTKQELVEEFGRHGFALEGFDSLYRGATPKWGNFGGFTIGDRIQMLLDRFRGKDWGCLYVMCFSRKSI